MQTNDPLVVLATLQSLPKLRQAVVAVITPKQFLVIVSLNATIVKGKTGCTATVLLSLILEPSHCTAALLHEKIRIGYRFMATQKRF